MGGGGMGGGGMGGGPGRFIVHMRGLPFKVTENDIAEVIHRDLQFFMLLTKVYFTHITKMANFFLVYFIVKQLYHVVEVQLG